MIINHNDPMYVSRRWSASTPNRYNGAYYYSKEICELMIPRVKTDRSWVTVNIWGKACDHAIVFIHNNKQTDRYEHLKEWKDLILVCGVPETCDKVKHLGTPIYLPLSIDVKAVQKFAKEEKTKEAAFVGRPIKRLGIKFPERVDKLEGIPRSKLLPMMADYKRIYGVGRVALEALALGCEVCAYDPRFPDPKVWKLLDTRDAAKILQEKLDEIDNV